MSNTNSNFSTESSPFLQPGERIIFQIRCLSTSAPRPNPQVYNSLAPILHQPPPFLSENLTVHPHLSLSENLTPTKTTKSQEGVGRINFKMSNKSVIILIIMLK